MRKKRKSFIFNKNGNKKDFVSKNKDMLLELDPMAIPLLSIKLEESPHNEWLRSTSNAIFKNPNKLTEKWVSTINNWVSEIVKASLLDPPSEEEGSRISFDPLRVYKIIPPKENDAWPSPAIICIDSRGWKWYFKTSKAYSFKKNDVITFTATISSHKEGISFLKRPSKIKKSAIVSRLDGDIND